MKLTRLSTFTASLLAFAMSAQTLAACGGTDPDLVEAGPDADRGKDTRVEGGADGNTTKPVEAGPDAPVVLIDAGVDGDADADSGTTTPVQPVEGLLSIAIEQSVKKAAVGTLVELTIKGTFSDKSGERKTIELKDFNQLEISFGADLIAIPTRDFGGLGLLAQKKGMTTFIVTEKKTGLSASGTIEVTDAKLQSLQLFKSEIVPKGVRTRVKAWAVYDDGRSQEVTPQAIFAVLPVGALEPLEGFNGTFIARREGAATISASFGGQKVEAILPVTSPIIDSVAFVAPPERVPFRSVHRLAVQATLSDGEKVAFREPAVWRSNDPGVLVVDENGIVTAVGMGSATINVRTANFRAASTTITVGEASLERLSVVAADETGAPIDSLKVGKTRRLALKGELSDQSVVDLTESAAWSSKEPTFLSVDNDKVKGLLTAKKAGDAVIVVKYGDAPAVEVAVKVVAAN